MPEFQLCPSDIFGAVLDYLCGKRSCHIVGRSTYFFHHETLDVALDEVGAETSTRTQDKINGPAVSFWLGMGRQVFRAQIRYRCQTFLDPLRAWGYSTRVPNLAVSWVQLLHQRRPKSWGTAMVANIIFIFSFFFTIVDIIEPRKTTNSSKSHLR